MAKTKTERIDDILRRRWPDKPVHESYEIMKGLLNDIGDVTRCKHESAKIVQKLEEIQ